MRQHIGVIYNNTDVINTSVAPLVGVVCIRVGEVGRVIDSWLGVVVCGVGSSEGEVEGASCVLRPDGADDAEVGTLQHLLPLLLPRRNPVCSGEPLLLPRRDPVCSGGRADVWLEQQICNNRTRCDWMRQQTCQ